MATLDYVAIPSVATRLDSAAPSSDIRPAKIICTSLPSSTTAEDCSSSTASTSTLTPTTGTFSILPQLLLSGTLPPGTIPTSSSGQDTSKDGSETKLLTTRDALSLPVMSINFKRFIARAHPIFWVQDRVEEIVMWRRGWAVTGVWMSAYAFLCYFPRLIFLLPHIALIAIILASYPYTSDPNIATPVSESSVNWQANLQAIQNLMGFIADIYDFVEPHTHHLILSPSHFPFNPLPSQSSRASTNFSLSRYPPYILTLLVLTFPPLLFILSSPFFPIRILCLVIGLGPLACTHPLVRPFYPFLGQILEDMAKYIIRMLVRVKRRAIILKPKHWSRWLSKTDTQSDVGIDVKDKVMPLRTILERIMDDDKLSDRCWRAEMREVELWENERFVGIASGGTTEELHIPTSTSYALKTPGTDSSTSTTPGAPPSMSPARTRTSSINLKLNIATYQIHPNASGWSKSNLRHAERGPWTRGRDGRGGVGAEVSNLTFSLAPGWAFIASEGWRKDRTARWAFSSDVGSSFNGWVYTNDVWDNPSPVPYSGTAGGGASVTRRRRWVRRVWFNGSVEGRGSSLHACM